MFSAYFLKELARQSNWSKSELMAMLHREFPVAADATLTWRIHDLKSRGLLYAAGRGKYTTLPAKPNYVPALTSGPLRIYQRVIASLPVEVVCCLTDTAWAGSLLDFSLSPTFILVESEKTQLNAAYEALTEFSRKVFLNPDADDVKRYVSTHDRAIVLRPLVSEAPTIEAKGVIVSSLEKMLVDAVVYADLYAGIQAHISRLFHLARDQYAVNESRLRRYARRRDRLQELEPYLSNETTN